MSSTLAIAPSLTPVQTPSLAPVLTSPTRLRNARRPSPDGYLNDAVSIYFADATLVSAFVARWCAGYKVETAEGVFR
jgi:hypothetical protein